MIHQTNIFSIPIYSTETTVVENRILDTELQELSEIIGGRTVSNSGGFQSNLLHLNVFESPDYFNLLNLIRIATFSAQEIATSLDYEGTVKFNSCWVNSNGEGDFNWPHNHEPSFLSAVYYVIAEPNCGNIVFHRPPGFLGYEKPKNYRPETQKSYVITPKTGQLLIFPGYLYHHVEPNVSGFDRISVAMNFDLCC